MIEAIAVSNSLIEALVTKSDNVEAIAVENNLIEAIVEE